MDIQKVVGKKKIFELSIKEKEKKKFIVSKIKIMFVFQKKIFLLKNKHNLNFRYNKFFLENIKKKKKIILFCQNISFFFFFYKILETFNYISLNGWIYEVNIKGLGLFCYVENNYIKMCLGQSHGILYKIPINIKINIKKNKIFFFGYSNIYLMNIVSLFLKLKKISKYKERGLILSTTSIKFKIGKKKKK